MNTKIPTRSSTQPNTIFHQLPNYRTNKTRPSTPPPTPPPTPSAPLKPMRLEHPDMIEPISKNIFSWLTEQPRPRKLEAEFVLDPESSAEWLKNKKKMDNGIYDYKCGRPNPNSGRKCTCATHDSIGLYSGCLEHYMWEENLNKYMNF